MSIPAQCPKCDARYKVKEELAGRRFVCKVCQAPVVVPSQAVEVGPDLNRLLDDEDASGSAVREFVPAREFDPAQETSTDLEMFADTSEELVLKRTSSFDLEESSTRRRQSGSLGKRLMTRLAQNPLSLPGLVFFLAWAPFSMLEPGFAWVVNIILGALCLAGAATVKGLEYLEIRFDNPLLMLNQLTFGALAGTASANSSSSGVLKRNKARPTGYDLALQLLIMLGFLALHTAVLTLKWYPLW